ncbi:HBS1-like protein isoform X1 [Solanum pennellii]|uniref:HBS1-like protein isoform X1 n=2 Tax=Solanum pennellii TaxID=28526 RepID=A0ABM1GF33_SOLPN|nr:HBS1-like protein isoform X1 [Solanum pennellii]XP_015070214.1 HBS1-like protein isoform X1 [Solanum pennellii]XP_015070215.1 HBS1-like protein isoform X1 [Solanum pennellii]XP_015070216.1 HBS1-like protein isoform X1 [Solanum pennellii]XP_027771281.1 HBS1-like protein isoform X1 [Solanum pennellii]
MPRKVNYGVKYEEDFDDYEDYGYDYDDGYDCAEEYGVPPETRLKQESVKSGIWRCPICTFDNEDTMNVCDICGVLRNPLVKKCVSSKENADGSRAVGGICKDSGASVMAESLFPSLLLQKAKNVINFEAQNYCFKTEDCFYYKPGNICGQFHDLHRAFCSQSHCKIDIVPFKFDSPSPDDLVLSGIAPSKLRPKADTDRILQLDISSNNKELSTEVKKELAAEGHPSSSTSLAKVKHDDLKDSGPASKTRGNNGLASNLNDISVSSKPQSVDTGKSDSAASSSKNKPEKIVQPPQTEDNFNQLNLAIVGHVDSGKSTLSGRLLHLLGRISHKEMHKYEKEAKQQGKGSFAYAWALDESAEERERGITMTVGVAYFNTKCYRVVLLDSPGHRDLVPNMISGATQADAAVLVIDASVGAFEAGIDATGGQTREHAQLIKSFGVDQIIIAVNKMDAVGYSQERFDAIKKQLGTFLRACKFKDSSVTWIPLSAMENQNLVTGPSESRFLSWFRGPCLLDAIDSLQPPQRDYSKPFLLPICDVVRAQSQGQVSICGKLERGALQTGNKVLVMPFRDVATVRSLERDSQVYNAAKAGDSVTINLQGIDANHVMAGGVLCHPEFPVPVANHLELKVLILDNGIPIVIGSQLEFLVHHAKEAARVVRILSLLDPKTGKETKKSPRCLLAKQNAMIEVVLQGMVCIDEHANCKALGRVSLRSSGRTVALGLVTRVIGKQE